MEETELLHQAGLSLDWVHEYVVESNKIDPQPGPSEPGSSVYDWHREALLYALRMASEDRYAIPKAIHQLLLRGHPLAGEPRSRDMKIGLNEVVPAGFVPKLLWRWNRHVYDTLHALRTGTDVDLDTKQAEIWALHCEFENIHPYEWLNGKVGR